MKQSLPGVSGYNPRIWDKVIETPRMTVAICLTPSGIRKMYELGWGDAVDSKPRKYGNPHYEAGYITGLQDLLN